MPNERLAGKQAIITGAATGIGAATARWFAAEGARVLASDIKEPGEVLGEALEEHPQTMRFEELDVRSPEDWQGAVDRCEQEFGPPNVLVNNAGTLGSGEPVHEESLEGMRETLEVNTLGIFLGMKTVIPVMLREAGGSIINVSSVWGLSGVANNAAYQTSKGAALMLSKNAGVTYAPHDIRVNCLLPGYVDTPMSRGVTDEEAERLLDFTPVGRRGEPDDIAPFIVYLASDESRFTAAGTFTIDGGMAAL